MIVLFAAVLALSGADAATVGAVAPQLESSVGINNTDLGLLSSVSLLVGAVFTIPVGLLVDRTKRMPLLALSIVLWSLASLFSAFAASFGGLLLTRLALGAVAASAGPAVAFAHGRLLRGRGAGAGLVLHPGRRGGRDGVWFHRQWLCGERDRLAGRVCGAGGSGVLPGAAASETPNHQPDRSRR